MDDNIFVKEEIHIIDSDLESEDQSTNLEYEEDDGVLKDVQPEENNTLNIIEERDNMITVSVGELYSEDERNFIENFNLKEMFAESAQPSITKVCIFCKKVFNNENSFLDHKKSGLCEYLWKQPFCCHICFLTFECSTKLYKHTRMHQRNMHFCKTGCGKYFRKIDLCYDHEFRDHDLDPHSKFKCWMCQAVLPSSNQLIQHKNIQHSYARRHVCSLCRTEYMTGIELSAHWKVSTCGLIKFDKQVLNSGGELVLQNINTNVETTTFTSTTTTTNKMNNKRKYDSDPGPESFTFKRIEIPHGISIKKEPIDEENMDISNKIMDNMSKDIKSELKSETIDEYEDNYCNRSSTSSSSSAKPIFTSILNRLRLPSIQKTTPEAVKKLDRNPIGNTGTTAYPGTTANIGTKENSETKNISNFRILKEYAEGVNGSGQRSQINSHENKQNYVVNNTNNTIPKNTITLVSNNNTQHFITNENDQLHNINRPLNVVTLPRNTRIVPINVVNFASQNNIPIVPKQISITKTVNNQRVGGGGGFSSQPSTLSPAAATTIDLSGEPSTSIMQPNQLELVNKSSPSVLIQKTRNRRIISLTNDTMNYIDNLPQSKKIIEDMKRQIRNIEQEKASIEATLVQEIPIENLVEPSQHDSNTSGGEETSALPPPSSLYLKLSNSTDDKLLNRIRKDHSNYRFSWMCPHCPRQYELKYAFRAHLLTMHYIAEKRIDNLKLEVRPFKLINLLEIAKNNTIIETESQLQKQLQPVVLNDNNTNVPILENPCIEFDESTSSSIQSDKTTDSKIMYQAKRANNGKYVCPKCRLDFPTLQMLENHRKGCSKPRKYQCSICSKRFSASGTLNCHMSIHTGELPHKCSYCDKRFRTRGQVTVHHRTHTGERPFTCQICSLGFTHRETLISHLSRHIGMKRYKCYGCSKTFSCISGLRTHRDVRPETCGLVKFSPRAIGPRVRVVKGVVIFEQQPEVNPYLRSENPPLTD